MPLWLEVARGPLFQFALVIMILGLLRLIVIVVGDMVLAMRRAGDKSKLPVLAGFKDTITWLLPTNLWRRARPVFFYMSFFFHIGIILSVLLLQNHIDILQAAVGVAWAALLRPVLDWIVLIAIISGLYVLGTRIYDSRSRLLSKPMDYLVLILILCVMISGFVAGQSWNPVPYSGLMLFHTLSGILLMIIAPFTKIAHCVLFPFIRLGTEIGWRLAAHGGSDVTRTLHGPDGRKI